MRAGKRKGRKNAKKNKKYKIGGQNRTKEVKRRK